MNPVTNPYVGTFMYGLLLGLGFTMSWCVVTSIWGELVRKARE